jgi:1-acyl-sn-glycerol-3-phosphate acyltransferase
MHNIVGSISVFVYFVNTVFWFIPIMIFSVLKIVPIPPWQKLLSYLLDSCAVAWIFVNNQNQKISSNTRWDVQGLDELIRHEWYMVIANHQSWVDILVLQRIFYRRIPFLKFFLKKELIWVPFLGLAWWALDFPFMRRYSKKFLEQNPHMKGKDLESTQKACRKFRLKPVSIMNFVEGTRFTQAKHARQQSEFKHLLRPKAGGMAFVLSSMKDNLNKLIDVTIYYPDGAPTYWDFVCGKVKSIKVNVRVLSLDELRQKGVIGHDYFENAEQRSAFQTWLNEQWAMKDKELSLMKSNKIQEETT